MLTTAPTVYLDSADDYASVLPTGVCGRIRIVEVGEGVEFNIRFLDHGKWTVRPIRIRPGQAVYRAEFTIVGEKFLGGNYEIYRCEGCPGLQEEWWLRDHATPEPNVRVSRLEHVER